MLSRKTITGISLGTAILFLPLSVPLCHASLALFLVCWAAEGRFGEKASLLKGSWMVWAYVIFFVLHVIGITYSENTADGWFNLEKKVALLLLPVAIASSFDLDRNMVRLLFQTFVAACIIGTIICLATAMRNFQLPPSLQNNFDFASHSLFEKFNPAANPNWMYFSYVGLAAGIGMHPTFFAMYLVFCVILIYHMYGGSFYLLSPLRKTALVAIILYFSIFIVMLSSRIVIIAYLPLCIIGIYQLAGRPVTFLLTSVVFLAMVILIASIDPVPRYRALQEPFAAESYQPNREGMYTYSTGIRKSLWVLGMEAVSEVNPVVGTGTGDVNDTLRKLGERNGTKNSIDSYDPHNQFVFIQVALGCVGLLSLLSCLVLPAWLACNQRHFMYVAFMFLFVLVCMTESALESQKGIVFFAIFNSILAFKYFKLEPVVIKKLVYG